MRPAYFLLVSRQTILLVNVEALQLNGLTRKSDNVSVYSKEIMTAYIWNKIMRMNINFMFNFLTKYHSFILTHWVAVRPTYFFYLSNASWFYSSMGKLCSLMG